MPADTLHLLQLHRVWWYDRSIPRAVRAHIREPHKGKTRYRVRLGSVTLAEAQRARPMQAAIFDTLLVEAERKSMREAIGKLRLP